MDDTFVIHKAEHTKQFLTHLNSLNPHIQFTAEAPCEKGAIPFLVTLVSIGPNVSLITSVYKTPIHWDQNLHWDNDYSFSTQFRVFKTLTHGTQTVCFDQELLGQEHNTLGLPLVGAITPTGSSTEYKPNWTFTLVFGTATPTTVQIGIRTTRPITSTLWSLTPKAWVTASREFVIKWGPSSF